MNFTLKQESLGMPFTFNNDYDRHKLNYYIYICYNKYCCERSQVIQWINKTSGTSILLQLKFYLYITKLWIPTWAN